MKKRILVVDDEVLILKSLQADLGAAGHDADTAESGESALLLFAGGNYDLVITDLMMEGVGGIELLSRIREKDPDVPVIVITGHGELETAVDALRLGAVDYLLKPYNNEELMLRIGNCIEKREMKKKIQFYENIFPVCSFCKKIRDDEGVEPGTGEWLDVEAYLGRKTGKNISHGICPQCYEKQMSELRKLTGK